MQLIRLKVSLIVEYFLNFLASVNLFFAEKQPKNLTLAHLPSLLLTCENNIGILENETNNQSKQKTQYVTDLLDSFNGITRVLKELGPMAEELRAVAPSYDFSAELPGNGYRTFVTIADKAAATADQVMRKCSSKMSSYDSSYPKEVAELLRFLRSITEVFTYLQRIRSTSAEGSLFPSKEITEDEIIELAEKVERSCFYGRFIANHFSYEMRFFLKAISLITVGYSEIFYEVPLWRAVIRIIKYSLDDDARGRRLVTVTEHAGVDFLQGFWNQADHLATRTVMALCNPIAVSETVIFEQGSVIVDGVEVTPSFSGPPKIEGILISSRVRDGMGAKKSSVPKSRGLIIHVHGGGFVGENARAQETFLRKWAHILHVPIFSLEYSLAPAAPFPHAVHEVFYGYCVALANAARLGSTAERVVFAGESAGGNLILAAVQECIKRGVRLPDGLFLAYVPVMLSFIPSPARILSVLDPILPYGFMLRCAKAYILGENSVKPWPSVSTCTCAECKETSQLSFLDNPHLEFPKEELHLEVPPDPYMNPYNASDSVLKRMPPTSIYVNTFDPCLDDGVMFAKKLQRLGNDVRLDIQDGLPHGSFNFCWASKDARKPIAIAAERIYELLGLPETLRQL